MEKYRPTKYTDMSNNDEPAGKTLLPVLQCSQGSGCPPNRNINDFHVNFGHSTP